MGVQRHGGFYVQRSCLRLYCGVSRRSAIASLEATHDTTEFCTTAIDKYSGLPISFGVFQDYYTTELPAFEGNPYVPLIGTTASGIPYLGAPLMAIVARRSQQYLGPIIWFGWLLCEVGLVVSSFVDTVPALIMSQGIMYGGMNHPLKSQTGRP